MAGSEQFGRVSRAWAGNTLPRVRTLASRPEASGEARKGGPKSDSCI